MGVHRPTAIVMGTLAGAYYADAVGDKVAIANLTEWRGRIYPSDAQHPGLHQHRRRQARRHERQPLRVRVCNTTPAL